ncbi:MAG: hypothetical protein M1546_27020 [Chloroflexi bacterium]|nr:hypothetical protein [Chloroflexota bacterium]
MAREVFFTRDVEGQSIEAAINYDETAFETAQDAVSPWTISIHTGGQDMGRLVGFEGEGQTIINMHHLKPDPGVQRAVEITVFRANDELRARKLDAAVFAAFERWLLKRGWRGNIVKLMKFTAAGQVVPVRRFWVGLGFEIVPGEEGRWDEHVVKRWR